MQGCGIGGWGLGRDEWGEEGLDDSWVSCMHA